MTTNSEGNDRGTGSAPDDAGGAGGFPVWAEPPLSGYPQPGSSVPGGTSGAAGPYGHASPGQLSAGPPGRYGAPPPGPPHPSAGYPGPFSPGTGYPPPPYPLPYPGYRPASTDRPGTVLGAAVLAFVAAGLDLVGALVTIALLVSVAAFAYPVWTDFAWSTAMQVSIVASVAAAGLLIAGGVVMLRGRSGALVAGAIVTAAIAVYWLVATQSPTAGTALPLSMRMYPLIYLALCVVMLGLALSSSARGWRPGRPMSR